ncbi:MAG: nickel-dependent lactate racemase [Acidobacteriota bacterium]|nr:MAG: nickel-dependent lactate racemase [Acidobacteriota bacterium]
MAVISLKYGSQELSLKFDPDLFDIIEASEPTTPLSDSEVGRKLDSPIGHSNIEEYVEKGGSVLLVVPDATRSSASGQIVNLLVRRLIASGIQPFDIRAIIATGIHRKTTDAEKADILTPFIYQRIKTLDHEPKDLMGLIRVGETATGVPVELNRALFEHDHVFLIGSVSFHYFAGFTGGRKLICPGLASSRTISETHKLAFDCETLSRRKGVGTGMLKGNPVHEAFLQAAAFVPRPFLITTLVNEAGECVDIFCGDLSASHEAACTAYAKNHSVTIKEKRDLVIASCGGSPYDINLIQAHKTLENASKACVDGGTIVLLAECQEGLGRDDMGKWFDAADSRDLAVRLCQKYQVNGQTAWSIREKSERFNILIVSNFDEDSVRSFGFEKIEFSALEQLVGTGGRTGYIVPRAASVNIKEKSRPN